VPDGLAFSAGSTLPFNPEMARATGAADLKAMKG